MMFKLCLIFSFLSFKISISETYCKPNIIFILADDLGWNDVSYHGSPEIPTPNIDALASNGIVLNKHYSLLLCTPSRGALMTGKYPIKLGLQRSVIETAAAYGLPLSEKILPQYLKDLGYKTHLIGKWHLGFYKKEFTPLYRGFDTFFGYYNGELDYYDYTCYGKLQNDTGINAIWGRDLHDGNVNVDGYRGLYATDLFTDKALKIIKNHDFTEPLFLLLSHLAVHVGNNYQPLQAPPEIVRQFRYITNKKRRIHAGVVAKLDESVGRVFHGLYEANVLDNTILVFISDNGGAVGNRGGIGSNYPLRGRKNQLYEGGVRVPALIWSSLFKLQEPRSTNELIHISDWLPTLYAAAGGDVKDLGDIDGVNMWDHLFYGARSSRKEILLNIDPIEKYGGIIHENFKLLLGNYPRNSWYGPTGHEDIAVASMDEWVWKNGSTVKNILQKINMWLINYPDIWRSKLAVYCGDKPPYVEGSTNITEPQLYNLLQDPCEYNNLAAEYPMITSFLQKRLQLYNATAIKPLYREADPRSDPSCYNFNFVPWLSEEYKSNCNI